MKKSEMYWEQLKQCGDWDEYLMQNSGLPGPRANLELVYTVVKLATEPRFIHMLDYVEQADANTPQEFIAVCGTVGLGRLVSEGKRDYLQTLRNLASDPRWRIREGVAMALQIVGERNMDGLLQEMSSWVEGNRFEKRAAAAALCEPKLLKQREHVWQVLRLLHRMTESILENVDRKEPGFLALKKGLAYCWSVAMVGDPEEGKPLFEQWMLCDDRDIRWIIKENLRKERLKRMDPVWVDLCIERLD